MAGEFLGGTHNILCMPIRLGKVIFRSIVYFCRFLELSPTECFRKLSQAFQSFNYCCQTVANWYEEIATEADIIPQKSGAGKHINDEVEKRIRDVLASTPNSTARSISNITKIPRTTVRRYLYDVIGLERVKAFFIPHEITEKLRKQRLYFAKVQLSILKQCEKCNFANVITGDESWFQDSYFSYYFYLPVGSQRPLVTKDHRGTRKIMIIVFFTGSGCLLLEALDHNSTIDTTKMESLIVPHLEQSWQSFLSSKSEAEKLAIRESTNLAVAAGEDTILRNKLSHIPCLPGYQSLADSDKLMLPIRTSIFSKSGEQQPESIVDDQTDDDPENGDNYHDEQTLPDYIVISSDDEDSDIERPSKRKAKLILEQLTQEELRFRNSLREDSSSQQSTVSFSSNPPSASQQSISTSQSGIISQDKGLLHMDNASPHNAERLRLALSRTSFLRFCHPPNSPDLAPADFFLFSYLKQHLQYQNTGDRDSLLKALQIILKEIPDSLWIKVFTDWEQRLEWVISHDGDYYPAHIRKANLRSHVLPSQDIPISQASSTNQSQDHFTSLPNAQSTPTDPPGQITANEDPQTPNTTIPSAINLSPSPETLPSFQPMSPPLQSQVILFENSGNTCYVNSLLQCLLSLSVFRWFYLYDTETVLQNDQLKQQLIIIPAIKAILQKIYHRSSAASPSQFNTIHFNLIDFIQVISSLYPAFSLGNQGDQHQLLQLLMEWTV